MPKEWDGEHPLSAARKAAGMTQPELAEAARAVARKRGFRSGIDKNRIWKWESGQCTPSWESQDLLREALGLPGGCHVISPWPEWLECTAPVFPLGKSGAVPALSNSLEDHVDRRSTLKSLGLAVVSLATGIPYATVSAAGQGGSSTVDEDLVGWLGETADLMASLPAGKRQYMQDSMKGNLATALGFIRDGRYSTKVGQKLHMAAARLAQTLGWCSFDHGRHAQAASYWNAATHSSYQAGDLNFTAFSLSDLAYQQLWLGDAQTAARIGARINCSRVEGRVAAAVQLRHAQAVAQIGDLKGAMGAVDDAQVRLNGADTGPTWAPWVSQEDISVDRGRCLMYSGDLRGALTLIRDGSPGLAGRREKTRAVIQVYEAEIVYALGDKDHALGLLSESISTARRVGAPRCVSQGEGLVRSIKGSM
jgi:transcriptional regulator with XRE-family HTH domain